MTFNSSNNLYGFPVALTRVFPSPIIAQRVPTTADYKYPIGQSWIDEVGENAYVLVNVAANVATWVVTASNPGTIDTLTGDSGGAISPSAGNISLLGTSNEITTTGSGSQIAFSLPATVVAPGSLATTTTLASGTTLTAGSSLSVTTSAVIGTTLTATGGLTTLAALTQTGATLINASGAALTTIGTGGTGAVHIGNATGNTSVTGALTASTTLTATSGNITATAGNFVSSAAGNGLVLNSGTASGTTTATLNGRSGQVTITTPSIAAGATFSFALTNSSVTASTTQVLYGLTGGTTGAALTIQSVTNSASTSTVVLQNASAVTNNSASLVLTFLVLN